MLFVYVNKDILGVLKENISVKHLKYNKAAQKYMYKCVYMSHLSPLWLSL